MIYVEDGAQEVCEVTTVNTIAEKDSTLSAEKIAGGSVFSEAGPKATYPSIFCSISLFPPIKTIR